MGAKHSVSAQEPDYFSRLPEEITLLIFTKVVDARSLCRCLLASKQFAAVLRQVPAVSLKLIDRPIAATSSDLGMSLPSRILSLLATPLRKLCYFFVMRHLRSNESALLRVMGFGSLKNFDSARTLEIDVPSGHKTKKVECVIKWKAEFGAILHSFVILLAEPSPSGQEEEQAAMDFMPMLIAAYECLHYAARLHYLFSRVAMDLPKLETALITDPDSQGKLCMNKTQLSELRESLSSSSEETSLKNSFLNMNLRVNIMMAPRPPLLECSTNMVTLILVRPPKETDVGLHDFDAEDLDIVAGAFDDEEGGFKEAADEIMSESARLSARSGHNTNV